MDAQLLVGEQVVFPVSSGEPAGNALRRVAQMVVAIGEDG